MLFAYLWISSDCRMGHVDHNHFKVLVGRILTNPVGIKDSQTLESTSNTLLGNGLKIPLWLLLLDGTRALGFTIGTSLGDWPFSSTTSHGNTVDDETLLGLVTKSSCLVWSSWAGSSMNL